MYKYRIGFIALILCLTGCALESIPPRGDKCPPAGKKGDLSFIVKSDNSQCQKESCPEYTVSFKDGYCPVDIPTCHQNSNQEYYCIMACPADQLACDGKCIDPTSNNDHCGGSGKCNSNEEGPDFKGVQCDSEHNYTCKDNKCILINNCESGIVCEGNCIKPNINDYSHCGAKGKCTDEEENDNYKGKNCAALMGNNAACKNDQCICTNGYVLFDNQCLDPKSDEHCGATDGNPGTTCMNNSHCEDNQCICNKGYAKCGDVCISGLSERDHCGAKGNCNSPNVDDNYEGEVCDINSSCEDGQCRCNNGYIKCGSECIDPMYNDMHCGAKGTCTSPQKGDNNYKGAECINEGLECSSGECKQLGGCQNDENACFENNCINKDDKCGRHCVDCNSYDHAKEGTCNVDAGKCETTVCEPKFHLKVDQSGCEPNRDDACAKVNSAAPVNCNTEHNAQKGICKDDGECEIQQCKPGYHPNQTLTDCIANSDEACATVESYSTVNCNTDNHATAGTCQLNGKCSSSSCQTGWHLHEHECEEDTNENCGDHNNKCEGPMYCKDAKCVIDSNDCSENTVAKLCSDGKICRNLVKDTGNSSTYDCFDPDTINTRCFWNSLVINCTIDTYHDRGVTKTCIYNPDLATNESGWTCECENPSDKFHMVGSTYTCNGKI